MKMEIPWDKIIIAALGAIGMWCAPRAARAVKNLGKGEAQRADEELKRALAKDEAARANTDPADDDAAAAEVRAAKAALVKALRLKDITDGVAGEE